MIKVDHKRQVCEMSGNDADNLTDIQLALHRLCHDISVKTGKPFEAVAEKLCMGTLTELKICEELVRRRLNIARQ